jgi:hypothetical protein
MGVAKMRGVLGMGPNLVNRAHTATIEGVNNQHISGENEQDPERNKCRRVVCNHVDSRENDNRDSDQIEFGRNWMDAAVGATAIGGREGLRFFPSITETSIDNDLGPAAVALLLQPWDQLELIP